MQHRPDLSVTPAEPSPAARPGTRRRSPIIRWVATAAAAAGIALVAAAPASAWDTDRPKLTDPGIDFGIHWDGFGAPFDGGELHWHVEPDGDVRPHLVGGNLYLNNASGTRARMKIEYFDAAHNEIHEEFGGIVDATDNGLHSFSVDLEPYEAPNIYHVHISTTTEGAPGVFNEVGEVGYDI